MGERTQEANDAAQSKIEKVLGDTPAGSKQVSNVVHAGANDGSGIAGNDDERTCGVATESEEGRHGARAVETRKMDNNG